MRKAVAISFAIVVAFVPRVALAHCPLCTIGAGAAAIVASRLGVNSMAIGVFVGAFAVALGLWMSMMTKKKYIPKQKEMFTVASFLLTILPLKPLWTDYTSFYVSISGEYGSLLNRTYLLNRFILGSVIGGIILVAAPSLSRLLSQARHGKSFPYQGMILTFGLLIASSVAIQFAL